MQQEQRASTELERASNKGAFFGALFGLFFGLILGWAAHAIVNYDTRQEYLDHLLRYHSKTAPILKPLTDKK